MIYAHFGGEMGETRGRKQNAEIAFSERLKKANQQLEKISIRVKDGRLHARGRSFPPKPGDTKGGRYEIALGVSATVSGLKVAIAKAKEMVVALSPTYLAEAFRPKANNAESVAGCTTAA